MRQLYFHSYQLITTEEEQWSVQNGNANGSESAGGGGAAAAAAARNGGCSRLHCHWWWESLFTRLLASFVDQLEAWGGSRRVARAGLAEKIGRGHAA